MTPFEEELRKALARCEPPEGLSERILDRLQVDRANLEKRARPRVGFSWRAMFGWQAASAVLALALATGGLAYREHERIEKGEAAKKQLLYAMHMAGAQLHEAQLRMKRIQFPEVVMQ